MLNEVREVKHLLLPEVSRILRSADYAQNDIKFTRFLLRIMSIDWVMTLPEALAEQLKVEVTQYEESLKMRYVTSFEQIAKREGSQENAQEFVQEALLTRFGTVTKTIVSTLGQIKDAEVLRELLRKAITADSLATFEKYLQDMVQPHHNN